MIYIILSVLCSVTVAVLLKLARRYKINITQAVTFNYLFAIGIGSIAFKPDFSKMPPLPIGIYILLGILLPSVFWLLAGSIRKIGIAKTDIAQRLSLILPIIAAYFLFHETFSITKIIGLILGFCAIIFILNKTSKVVSDKKDIIYPVLVFLGFGVIDILFKQIAQIQSVPYTTSLIFVFFISFMVSLISIGYLVVIKKEKFQFINVICGCILGLFNFGNILFYLKAHQALSDHPSTVFAIMNMGVIACGCLVGIIIFKEKLNSLNFIGIFMAIAAVILIAIS